MSSETIILWLNEIRLAAAPPTDKNSTAFSLKVLAGDFIVIAGHSGSEKSEFLHVAAGLRKPRHGSVRLLGNEMTDQHFYDPFALRRKTGFVFQSPIFISELTSLENIQLPLRYDGLLQENQIADKTKEVLSLAGLSTELNRMPDELTPLDRRKVELARAWIRDPDIVFYDEPAKGFDPIAKQTIYKIIHHYHENRKSENRPCAALLTCNDLQGPLELADQIFVLRDGILTFKGDKTNIRDQHSRIEKDFLDSIIHL